jgi:Xaa-Pro aminopeptidase
MFDDLRAKKDPDECACIIEAQRITDAAFSHILGHIREGVSECDIALELEYYMRKMGASARSFDIICASGSASSRPHAVPRSTPIERGLLTMDFGCVYRGYCSDMTRTVCFGLAREDEKKLYSTVLEAQRAALAYITEGVRCTEVDRMAREVTERGYAGGFSHGLGHGVGRRIHESPRLSPRAGDKRLAHGHVVTVEPGIYIEGKYGCRIEDMVIIGDGSAKNITSSPKELIEI